MFEWTKYPFNLYTEQNVEVNFQGQITQIPSEDAIHTNFLQFGFEIAPANYPYITRQLGPLKMQIDFHSLKSYTSVATGFTEKKLYYLRITNLEESKNLLVLFGRVGSKPPLKGVLRPADIYVKKALVISSFEKTLIQEKAKTKESGSSKFLYFERPVILYASSL